jgi:hypothetical protein
MRAALKNEVGVKGYNGFYLTGSIFFDNVTFYDCQTNV